MIRRPLAGSIQGQISVAGLKSFALTGHSFENKVQINSVKKMRPAYKDTNLRI